MKSTKSALMLLLVLLYYVQVGNAQRTIVGKVTDCEGEPLQGAIIQIKGYGTGALANEHGFYRIEIPQEYDNRKLMLLFSAFGTVVKKVKGKGIDTLNIKLEQHPDEQQNIQVDKPVIYLYPEKQTEVNLQVNFNGKLDFTYPPYKNGWQVIARPDGTLTDKNDGRKHQYLFWDGKMQFSKEQKTYATGFVVHKDSLVAFFQKHLPKMGLEAHEYNDFIVFWTPLMQKNEWNFIHFRTGAAYDIISTNTVIPKPDTEIRIFMEFAKVAKPFDIPAQQLPTPQRKGFTLVEWGGAALEWAHFEVPYIIIKQECPEIEVAPTRCIGPAKPFNPTKI